MTNNFHTPVIKRYGTAIVVLAWLLTTAAYYLHFGLITGLEAEKYIREANYFIEHGHLSAPRFWFYSPTIFIIVLSFKLHIGLYGAFIIQAIINLLAYLLLYKALTKIFSSPLTCILTILYLLLFWPYQSWVVYLYTESVYFSAVLILVSVLILYKPDNLKNILFIGGALLLVIISRPLGILFAVSTYCYLFFHAGRKWKIIIGVGSVLLMIAGFFVVNTVFSTIEDWKITQAFEQEEIICNWPGKEPYSKLDLAAGSPAYQLWYYITHNFSHFLRFAGIKLQYFFLMTRDYYSKGHNYFLLLNIIPVYLMCLVSFLTRQFKSYKGIALFILLSLLLYTLTIIFQCDDYHNRFVLSVFPLFAIPAAMGTEYTLSKFFKHRV